MVSTLKRRGDSYYCSRCEMRQFQLKPHCIFCGDLFSNFESIMVQRKQEQLSDEAKERKENK